MRERWVKEDEDGGFAVFRKGKKRMDIVEIDYSDGRKVRDFIIYEPDNLKGNVMVRRIECPSENQKKI